jgi:hypothetical protein
MFELRKICEGEYGIQLEYTAPHIPQHNGVVERMFSRDAKRALAMMISAAWTKEMQAKLWAEATKTAAILGSSLPNTRSAVPPDELFYVKPSDIYTHLIEFGRVGYVTNRSTMKGKFKEKANPIVMIGYGENHARDVYRMYNPVTSKVVETRDIHAWADITNATNDIRLTMSEIYDPELILEEPETPEVIEEPDEDSPPIHIIPTYEDELAESTSNLNFPLSGAGRMYEEEKKTLEEKDSRIEQENEEDDEERSDESNSTQTDDSDVDDLPEIYTRTNAPEMERYGADDITVEAGEQAERPQHNSTRLKNEMKRLGIEVPANHD